MFRQCDLLESMSWRIIERFESEQTQRSVANDVRVARSVTSRVWTRCPETESSVFEVN